MKIDIYDIEKAYRNFFEKQQYQIEIFQGLRMTIDEYATLDSFQGLTAENSKSYMGDAHLSVIDSIELALMELEIRLLILKQDFNATVDESSNAVVDENYIGQTIESIDDYINSANSHDEDVNTLLSSVSSLVSLSNPSIPDYVMLMTSAKTNAENTLENLLDFDSRHTNDMENINDMFSAIVSAIQFMSETENIGKYTAQSASETEWSKLMYTCQIKAYLYATEADPNFSDTIYLEFAIQTGLTMLDALIPDGANMDEVMKHLDSLSEGKDLLELGANISDATREAVQAFRFFRDGIRFVAQIDAGTGETVIKAVSVAGKALTRSQQVIALRAAGIAGDVSRTTARSLASSLFSANGLQVTGTDAYKLKNRALNADTIAALTKAVSAGEDATSFMKEFAKGIKGAKPLEWILLGVSVTIDVADAFYDERTRKFSEFDAVEFASNAIVTTGSFLAPIAAGAYAGSVVPGIGNVVGAGVGLVIGVLNFVEWGQPPKNIFEHTSNFLEDTFNDIGNWFSKVFW